MGVDEARNHVEAFEGAAVGRGRSVPAAWNQLTHDVIGCAMRVHSALGPGLPEKMYGAALRRELDKCGMPHLQEHTIEVDYEGVNIGTLRIDVLVDDILVLELKAVEAAHDLHLAQLVSYLRAGRFALGLLINFNVLRLKDGIYRRLNSDALPP
jgi:GxxExxY protein